MRIDEKTLRNMYENKEMAMNKIAKELGVSTSKVFNDLKYYGIESRKTLTDSQKEAISRKNKGRVSPRKGIHISEETKQKMSASHKGKFTNPTKFGGHRKKRADGYIAIYNPEHSRASKDGYVMEHILIVEKYIGRPLKDGEVVHHKNFIRDDNRIDNLQLMTNHDHMSYHMTVRWEQKRREKKYGTQ